jgi:hypothetical protein
MLVRLTTLIAVAAAAATVALPALAPAATQPKPVVLAYTVTNGKVVKGNKQPKVKKGRVVKFVVVANRGEELHLHGYDLERVIRPRKQTVMQFTAKLTGRFELELHHPDVVIARLSVTP